mmetsp:Transcript_30436/g.71577  ORF Transcript_30436/g.71577 Transcript_30436/m.71577 type:complete len:127 (-) Transcript_30436:28-408(-)
MVSLEDLTRSLNKERADLGFSYSKQPTFPIATSKDLKTWRLGTDTVTAPLHELRTRPYEAKNRVRSASGALLFIFTFSRQLKGLSGCYEYFDQHRGSPCFKRWRRSSASTAAALASDAGSFRGSSF